MLNRKAWRRILVGVAGGLLLHAWLPDERRALREALFAEIQPIALSNCTLERFGEPNDGGYLLCGNLLGDVQAGYSYGISGYDGWGCQVSARLGVTVHQYDCFDTRPPACPAGQTVFHAECVGSTATVDGRRFDTVARHVTANGDAGRRLVVKMDVEGAEWETFMSADDELLASIDQLVVEFHRVEDATFVAAMRRLKQHFHVAHLHFNNVVCEPAAAPFPSLAYEVLLVNKRLAVPAPSAPSPGRPHALDAVNNPVLPDCQYLPAD